MVFLNILYTYILIYSDIYMVIALLISVYSCVSSFTNIHSRYEAVDQLRCYDGISTPSERLIVNISHWFSLALSAK